MKETQLLLKLANILKIWLHHIMDKVICDDQIFFHADNHIFGHLVKFWSKETGK